MRWLKRQLNLALFLLLILNNGAIYSQDWSFGGKVGYNLNAAHLRLQTPSLFEELYANYTHGFYLGYLAERQFKNNWSVRTELLYNRVGGRIDIKTLVDNTVIRTDFLSLPIVAGYQLTDWLQVNAGGFAALRLNFLETRDGLQIKEYEDQYSIIDAGILMGGEIRLTNSLFIEGRFTIGIVRQKPTDNMVFIDRAELVSYENRYTSLGLKYEF